MIEKGPSVDCCGTGIALLEQLQDFSPIISASTYFFA